jgi:ribosomal protein L31
VIEMDQKTNIKPPYYPEVEVWTMCDEKGKTYAGAPRKRKLVWEVDDNSGGAFTAKSQFGAEVLSVLYDIQKRIEKIEKKLEARKK